MLESSNGQTGLRLAQLHGCDAILLDLKLPELSGAEMIEELKRRNETREIPIIVIADRLEALQGPHLQGTQGTIQRRFVPSDVIGKLWRALPNGSRRGERNGSPDDTAHRVRADTELRVAAGRG